MHEKAGFNDPFWLAAVAFMKLGKLGQPLENKQSRMIDFGCGTGLLGIEL